MTAPTPTSTEREAQEAWLAYRDQRLREGHRETSMRRRDFIAGYEAAHDDNDEGDN